MRGGLGRFETVSASGRSDAGSPDRVVRHVDSSRRTAFHSTGALLFSRGEGAETAKLFNLGRGSRVMVRVCVPPHNTKAGKRTGLGFTRFVASADTVEVFRRRMKRFDQRRRRFCFALTLVRMSRALKRPLFGCSRRSVSSLAGAGGSSVHDARTRRSRRFRRGHSSTMRR